MQNFQAPTLGSSPKADDVHQTGETSNGPEPFSVGAEITITGNIEAAGDLHIEGHVVGDVRCETLILGEFSKISGSIQADRIRVAGTVEGRIETRDLAVEATGLVTGEITYGRLRVANGASVEGRLKCTIPLDPEPTETSWGPVQGRRRS